MSRRVEVTRFVVGVACLTTVLALLWLLLWITLVPLALGWTPVAIMSGSMGPGIATGDVVVAAPADAGSVGRGSVIVFDNPAGEGRVTHRVVDVDLSGRYITRGDANARIDSTTVPRHAVDGVGRILVPAIGAPVAWADGGQWHRLLLGLIVVTAAAWTSRWAVLARFDPFAHAGASLGHIAVGWNRAVSSLRLPDAPRLTVRSGRHLVAGAAAVGLVASLAMGGVLQADGAFASTANNGGNAVDTDTLEPPTGVSATGGATVDLDWTATTDTYASGHRVYRATTSGGPYAQVAQITPRATVTYTDSPADGTYYYVLRAYFGPWESADSAEVSATVTTAEDYDGIIAAVDNCPSTFNVDQFDTDGDGTGDACDASPTLASTATFTDSGQTLDAGPGFDTAIGDLDGDGDLDIVYANNSAPNTVWFNDGSGTFTNSGQSLDSTRSEGVALGDLDSDGDLDIVYANNNDPNTVWFNDGSGTFTNSGQSLDSNRTEGLAVGDFDGDGDLDIAFANDGDPNTIYLNDGTGTFTDSGQVLSASDRSSSVAVGDLDGDGDLDVAFANNGDPNTVWLNDGSGLFSDSGQTLGTNEDSQGLALADLDGDGDSDIVYAHDNDPNAVWFNDGSGTFTDSGQALGTNEASRGPAVGDLDGDGDLDVTFANIGAPNTVWLNNGAGVLTDSGQTLGTNEASQGLAFGDVDGDGDLDVTFANDGDPNTVWFNS